MNEVVECRSDSTYAERPVAFTWAGSRLDVSEIVRRWRSPGVRGFRVRASTGGSFELLYDEHNDTWSIQNL
ncbi:MAG: hypothetical protein ACWGO1_05925 [Anaerolineales bacterium]